MKRIYIQFLLLLLVSTFSIDLQAQRLNIPEKSTIGDEFLIAPDGTYSELKPYLSGRCNGCEISDLSFNWSGSFNDAIVNENLIRLARKRALRKWYSNQINNIVKPAIDRKFGRKFSNFEKAKNELLIDSERKNIAILSRPIQRKYSRLRTQGFKTKEKHLKELKLLKLREAEIKSGNINNSSFGYIKVQGVYLKDIKSLSSLKSKWTPLFIDFSKNMAETHINNHMFKSIGRGVEPEVIKLKNQHYNSLNMWDKLSLLQFLVHYEEYKKLSSPPYLVPEHINNMFKKFNNIDKATPKLIESLSIKNRTGGYSVFDIRTYYKLLETNMPPPTSEDEYMAKMEWERLKNQALDKLLNSTSTADFAITNFIEELKITNTKQKEWLYKHKSEANKLVKFANDNRYRGFVNLYAKKFVNNAIEAYMKNIDVVFEQTKVTEVINNIQNPITGNPVELYLIAKHKRNILLYLSSYSTSREIKVGDYYLKPHYDKAKKLVFYTAYRTDSSGRSLFGIEMLIKASGLKDFKENISLYTSGANLFYLQGVPSEGQIALAAGDYWNGLGKMWKDAVHSPEWWAYVITSFGHAITNLPTNSTVSSTKTVTKWKVPLNRMTNKSFQGKVVKNPQGVKVTINIPDSYVPRIVDNGKGIKFVPQGTPLNSDANAIRIMKPTTTGTYPKPKGYVVFHNNFGQPMNPLNGQTLSKGNWHFEF
ncbi:hypothetical protein [Tenacibaculum singaporense]|uniref:Uncharacterized protein n=1 Tax=Tenacibaculum singaporense TaxID=2358479 RepID=A0A3Q8RRX7_9FLAO|nr:hypothetical protein [Tenacibaculum singaporense]AZJ35984.1 hypothetical protein D6T69_10800 [Tenacibaculum singaporense]